MLKGLWRKVRGPSPSRVFAGPMITIGVICCYDENVRLRPGDVHTCGHCGREFELFTDMSNRSVIRETEDYTGAKEHFVECEVFERAGRGRP